MLGPPVDKIHGVVHLFFMTWRMVFTYVTWRMCSSILKCSQTSARFIEHFWRIYVGYGFSTHRVVPVILFWGSLGLIIFICIVIYVFLRLPQIFLGLSQRLPKSLV